jgi:hypothetical protein
LVPSVESAGELRCACCAGLFLPADKIQGELLQDAVVADSAATMPAATGTDGATSSQAATPAIDCPVCGKPMQRLGLAEAEIDRCHSCGGVWLDPHDVLPAGMPADAASVLSRYLLYSLTLPERAVRSTIGLAAGAATEAAGLVVPQAFQSSKTYEIVIRNSLRFLTRDIGGVAGDAASEDASVDNYMARKAVGNFVDLAGLATLHLSPLWLLAVVSDVAYGSKAYVLELATELKQQGLIDDTSTIHHVDDILAAVQKASGTAASTFDTPPLSVEELRRSLNETRDAVRSADYTSILPESEIKQYWSEMQAIARRDNVSLTAVSGAMTMHSLNKLKTISQGAITGIQVAGGLFNRHVVGHYADSLHAIREKGFYETMRHSSAPYVEAVWKNFASERETWTGQVVSGRLFGKAYSALKGWFGERIPRL